jgi:hypothetical protein
MNYRQKKSHHEYRPLPRDAGDPDEKESMRHLPRSSREKLEKLYDDGTLKTGDLDHKSLVTLQQLTEPLQLKVIEYLETERLFLANSRSKAGFLVSACDRAKKGELDARGFGALDPWRTALLAECKPRPNIELVSESEWVSKRTDPSITIKLVMPDGDARSFVVSLTESVSQVKDTLYDAVSDVYDFPRSRFKLSHAVYGSLREERTLAYYNIEDQSELVCKLKLRGGRRVNRQYS